MRVSPSDCWVVVSSGCMMRMGTPDEMFCPDASTTPDQAREAAWACAAMHQAEVGGSTLTYDVMSLDEFFWRYRDQELARVQYLGV